MEKKFFLKSNGEPVTIGTMITLHRESKTPYGNVTEQTTFPVTPDNLDALIKDGIVVCKTEKGKSKSPSTDIESYIEGLASREGWCYPKMLSYIEKLDEIYSPAAFSLLLKAIAKRLDKKYEGHISESKEVWVVSLLNGKASQVDKKAIINYDNFAAFRTKEDAEFAIKVLDQFIKDMFSE